jgi:glycosyltransferase involved in cell wall biosynthesis
VKIVIPAWHLRSTNVGLGRYAVDLLNGLGRVDRSNEYIVVTPVPPPSSVTRVANVRCRVIRFPVVKRRFWEQVAPRLAGDCDVVHFPYDAAVRSTRAKLIVTIHDVKPLIFGGESRPNLSGWLHRLLIGDPRSRIDHVITDSECSRRDIIDRLHIAPERISVVYPGVEHARFRPKPTASTSLRPYVLCVAGSDPTKNVETLVRAFAGLSSAVRGAHDLVLAGDFRGRPELKTIAEQLGLAKQVWFPGVVSDETLVALYQEASVFAFPSRYEGFGLPVLEAMACGCPVVASDASSLPEVVGKAGLLLPPLDAAAWSAGLERALTDSALREDLRRNGFLQAARFTWDQTATGVVEVYNKVTR